MKMKPSAARREATKLEEAGCSISEIAKQLGYHYDTIRGWLREDRGKPKMVPTLTARITALLKKGKPHSEIAKELNCSESHVRRVQREKLGIVKAKHRSGPEMVAEFQAAPQEARRESFVRTDSFGRALIFRCKEAVNDRPAEAINLLNEAFDLLEYLLATSRSEARRRKTTCDLIQIEASRAARLLALQQPEQAWADLAKIRGRHDLCCFCNADLLRRESLALVEVQEFERSLEKVREAKQIYRDQRESGHDPDRNGLGNCTLVESQVLFLRGDSRSDPSSYEKAAQLADRAIETGLVTRKHRPIMVALLHTSAYAHLRLNNFVRAQERNAELLAYFSGRPSTVPYLKVQWLAAQLSEACNDDSRGHYEKAERIAKDLKRPEVLAVIADSLWGTPELNTSELRSRMDGLRMWCPKTGLKLMPNFLEPASQIIDQAVALAHRRPREALRLLRSFGDDFMPRLQPALLIKMPGPA